MDAFNYPINKFLERQITVPMCVNISKTFKIFFQTAFQKEVTITDHTTVDHQ